MSNVSTLTRGRKFNINKFVVNRAWEIAKNASVAHNTNPVDVASQGLTRSSEYFAEAMRIAWVEGKRKAAKMDNFEVYTLHKVPKKNQSKIITDLATAIVVKGIVKAKRNELAVQTISRAATDSCFHKLYLATAVFNARFGTAVSKSQNRHILAELGSIVETGIVSDVNQKESTYA